MTNPTFEHLLNNMKKHNMLILDELVELRGEISMVEPANMMLLMLEDVDRIIELVKGAEE